MSTLISLRTEVYINADEIYIIMQRPDINNNMQKYIEPQDVNLYNKATNIIEDAKSRGMFFDISGRDEVIRSLIIMKNGMVIGTNNLPQTIIKRATNNEVYFTNKQHKASRGKDLNK